MLNVVPPGGTNSHPEIQYRKLAISERYCGAPRRPIPSIEKQVYLSGEVYATDAVLSPTTEIVSATNVQSTLQFRDILMPLPQLRLENAAIRLYDEHHNGKALAFSKVEIINPRIIIGSNDVLIAVRDLIIQDSTVTSGFPTLPSRGPG